MREKLKPCPFCGGNKLTVSRYFGLNCYTVRCINEDCGMKVVTDFAKTKKEAIELWNTRPNPWHTGTPTEEGWYLIAYECVYDCKNKGKIEYFTLNIITDEYGYRDYRGRTSDDVWKAVAYQKIEPYRG